MIVKGRTVELEAPPRRLITVGEGAFGEGTSSHFVWHYAVRRDQGLAFKEVVYRTNHRCRPLGR